VLRFKAFSGRDIPVLEQQINAWLARAEPDVKMMDQSVLPDGALTISFLYDEGFRASEERLAEEATAIVEHALHEETVLEPIKVDQEQV
jgi:hypothetical protein